MNRTALEDANGIEAADPALLHAVARMRAEVDMAIGPSDLVDYRLQIGRRRPKIQHGSLRFICHEPINMIGDTSCQLTSGKEVPVSSHSEVG